MAMGHSGADHSAVDILKNLLIMLLTGIGGGVLFGWVLHECITRKFVLITLSMFLCLPL